MELITDNDHQKNNGNWKSFLFKNYFFFTQINDLEIVMKEFASEEYCKIIKQILIAAFDSMGLHAFINYKKLPSKVRKMYKEKLKEEIQNILTNNRHHINQKNKVKLSFLTPWLKMENIRKMSKTVKNGLIFVTKEEDIDLKQFKEEDIKIEISSNIKNEVNRLMNRNRTKKILNKMGLNEQTIFLRDYIKSEFYKESELNEIQNKYISKEILKNPFKLSKSSL